MVDFGDQRVLGALAADIQVCAIKVSKAGTLQSIANATFVVINHRNKTVGGHVIHEEFHGFTAALHTSVEFGIGFGECSSVEVGPSQIKAAQPCIEHSVGFCK